MTGRTVKSLYGKGWADIKQIVDRLTRNERCEWEQRASDDAVRAAVVIGYLTARGVSGCGDNGHDEGVKHAMRMRKAVRKAIGYTNP